MTLPTRPLSAAFDRWPLARQLTATLAVAVALATAASAVVLGPDQVRPYVATLALGYLGLSIAHALRPGPIVAVVLSGVALTWPVALGDGGVGATAVLVSLVVVAAELLAAAAEHAVVVDHPAEPGLRRAVGAGAVAGGAGAAMAVATAAPWVPGAAGTVVAGLAAAVAVSFLAR